VVPDAIDRKPASRAGRGASEGRAGLGVVTFGPEGGGIAYVARLLARAMSELYPSPWIAQLRTEGGGAVGVGEGLRFAARVAYAQLTGRADWILLNHAGLARAQRWMPSALRRPYGVFLHDVEAWGEELTAARKAVLRFATLRIGNSAYTARRTERAHPDIGPVMPCPLGLLPREDVGGIVDHALLAAIGPASALIVGRVASCDRYKGHDQLIEAWPAVVRRVPQAQLVVVGAGDDIPRLRAKAGEVGAADKVLFTGFVSQSTLDRLWDRASLLTMPSRREGFGLVYLEAMRAGLPCIGSPEDAASEVIVHGATGLLIAQQDREGLAGAVAGLLLDHGRRKMMGAAGKRRFESEFTYAHFRGRLRAVLAAGFGAGGGRLA
jgi:phosphatidyl-myo-inositol dimannoside synthase